MKMRLMAPVFLSLLCFLPEAQACVVQKGFDPAGSQLAIRDPSFTYMEDEGRRTVTTFATIENRSNACVEDIVVEVKYLDKDRNIVDVVIQNLDPLALPPGRAATFRVRDRPDKARSAYASNVVRVLSVRQRTPADGTGKQKEEDSLLLSLLVSWGPMILLIAVWIIVMRRLAGKGSTQERQTQALERIASALDDAAVARREAARVSSSL